jgi:hypothetical protein
MGSNSIFSEGMIVKKAEQSSQVIRQLSIGYYTTSITISIFYFPFPHSISSKIYRYSGRTKSAKVSGSFASAW